jgi:TatD DNase family protein
MHSLTDTHCHLHFDQFYDDLPQVIQRAREAVVSRILTLGTELQSSLESLKIAKKYAGVFAAAGIHPTDVFKSGPDDSAKIHRLIQEEERIIAVGEIGLDLHWKEVPLSEQLTIFEQMLEIAVALDLPVVIHNREAHPEMRRFFIHSGTEKLKGVMHSFSGTVDDALFYLEMGLHVSFTGVVTFKNFEYKEVVRSIPLSRLLLETDSPFLAPVPKRGKRNEPAFVRYTAEKLSEIFEVPLQQLLQITSDNANRLFHWEE